MPTGYTAELMEKGMDLKPFVLQCARNFGALITMRDDPMDAKIPEKFEPSDYSVKALAEANAKHSFLFTMTESERIAFGDLEKESAIIQRKEYIKKQTEENIRLLEMQSKVEAWRPPTSDHEGLKRFMLDQIRISLNDITYHEKELHNLESSAPITFHIKALSDSVWSIKYHTEEIAKETNRAEERTAWVRQLWNSL